ACSMQLGQAHPTFAGVWVIDGASVWGRLLILGGTAVVVLLSPAWLAHDRRHGEYYAILLFSALGAMALAGAMDLLQLIVAVLLSSVTGYTLAAYHRDWPLSVEAGMKYFLIGAFANALLVLGVTLIYGLAGSTSFAALENAFARATDPSPLLLTGTALVVVGLAFKLGAVPAHSWMPDVAEGAPVPSAAFLTVVPKIGAAVALARFVSLFPPEAVAVPWLIAILSAATMTLGNLAALWQDDLRRLLGWSSVSQSGYALMAVCVIGSTALAPQALLFFLFGYAAANLTAFAVVAHLRGRTALADYAGLATTRPYLTIALALSLLSFVGIPPLAGFLGKLTLFLATIEGGYAWLAIVAVANSVISLFYYLRVVGKAAFAQAGSRPSALGRWTAIATALAAFLVVAGGLAGDPLLAALARAELLP
ncbi:MAG TPA: NADH-quinone oxidoreductase subunit N, partial [Steroidobacteraceae bacterium]|nr:NADH-quinone oxidoreductase subunit N [Steroidobacteraceae bacterium]